MGTNEWLAYFDASKDKFKWFFEEYGYQNYWNTLIKHRKMNDKTGMLRIMSHIWYVLPDEIFNIRNNPPGWNEFLNLLDEE